MRRYQQGDVVLVQVEAALGVKCVRQDGMLAEGEATGHAHRFVGSFTVYGDGPAVAVLEAPAGGVLEHAEHGSIAIAPGTYEVRRVREYDHFAEEARRVTD